METLTEYACYIERGDFLKTNDGHVEIDNIVDDGDFIVLWGTDTNDDYISLTRGPFDEVVRIVSFEE